MPDPLNPANGFYEVDYDKEFNSEFVLGRLKERFQGIPPFSVLSARDGWWTKRKKMWYDFGVKGKVGSELLHKSDDDEIDPVLDNDMWTGETVRNISHYKEKREREQREKLDALKGVQKSAKCFNIDMEYGDDVKKRKALTSERMRKLNEVSTSEKYDRATASTPIFDPVLCELAYKWFCVPNGDIFDPFTGGCVSGVVAESLGFHFTGIDLREEQVLANRERLAWINKTRRVNLSPNWIIGDSTKIKSLVPEDQMFDMIWSCHPKTVKISTERGQVPINEVVSGDRVLTHTGKIREVSETLSFLYSGDLVEISRDYRSYPLTATADHPLFVKRLVRKECACGCGQVPSWGNYVRGHNNKGKVWGSETGLGFSSHATRYMNGDEESEWLHAGDVRVGDFLLEPVPQAPKNPLDGEVVWRHTPPVKNHNKGRPFSGANFVQATKMLGRLVGYYLSEGWTSEYSTEFAFHKDEVGFHDDVRNGWGVIFGEDLKVTVRSNERCDNGIAGVTVGCCGTIASQFFTETCGVGADKKRVPEWVWDCSDEIVAEVIKGMWRGDGWFNNDDEDFGYASVSENMVEDLRRLLLRLGIIASVRMRKGRPNNYCANPLPQWCLAVRGVHADKLAEVLGEVRKLGRRRPFRGPFIRDGYVHYKVRKVVSNPVEKLPVYNLEVNDDHSYLADGVSSHNCPPYYDLVVYSNREGDGSNLSTYEEFMDWYRKLFYKCLKRLKDNRFVGIVVGDLRDKDGAYRNFIGDNVECFTDLGLHYYNEIILVMSVGSLPIRVGKQFSRHRKVGKAHQNVLIFYKGNPREICNHFPNLGVDVYEATPDEDDTEVKAQ